MKKNAKHGIYTTGKEYFSISDGGNENIIQIEAIDEIPFLNLRPGQCTKLNKEAFESFLNEELKHYYWHKE